MLVTITAARRGANNGDPMTAVRVAARWCLDAARAPTTAPPRGAVLEAVAAAVAEGETVTRAALDALALALARWCEEASTGPYDDLALAPLALAALNAAAAATCAETRDAPHDGDPFGT